MPDVNVPHLLDRAGRSGIGAGRPRQADLRRGVSDAYYALFHGLTAAIAEQTLRGVPPTAIQAFRRKLSHGALRDRCARIALGNKLPAPRALAMAATNDPNARLVAQTFVNLQAERILADYQHDESFGLMRLNEAIASAERALATISTHAQDPGMTSLLALLALASGWSADDS